jgi:hypothetical protein
LILCNQNPKGFTNEYRKALVSIEDLEGILSQ